MSIFSVFRKRKAIEAPWSKYYTKEQMDINIPNISMYEQLRRCAEKFDNNVAYKYFNSKVSYKNFMLKIDKAALSFKKIGVKKGTVVTFCLPNVPEVLIAIYALNKLGAIANMIHPMSAPEEIKQSLITTNSKYLILLDIFYKKNEEILNTADLKNVIFVSATNSMDLFTKIGYKITTIGKMKKLPNDKKYLTWFKFLKFSNSISDAKFPKLGKDTPAVILHSGGTSGTPKNVILQNRAFVLSSLQGHIVLKQLKLGDSCLTIMPNFHGFGLSASMHTPLTIGCSVILIPTFSAKKFDTLLKRNKPSCILGVPTLYEALINSKNEKNLDLSCLKYVICGGDALNKNLEEMVNEYLEAHNASARITQGYGMTEVLAAVSLACERFSKSGSMGIPLPGNHIKIIDQATRKTLPSNEIGEICIHTKAFMMGYLNNESETNDALQIHDDGHIWLHTGDLGYMDEEGFIFYVGRKKRMIISSGYNVYPSHVEEIIESHPAVLQCTVVGMKHPYKKEVVKAFIVLKEGFHGMFIKSEIKDYCKKNLSHYMVPYKFVYRKKLPTTKLGKVDFKKLESDIGVDDDE